MYMVATAHWDSSNDDIFNTVRLEAMRYPREAFDPSDSLHSPAPSFLHTLSFSYAFEMREILKWIVRNPPVPSIHTLRLGLWQEEDLLPMAELLQALGPRVNNIIIDSSKGLPTCYGACCFLTLKWCLIFPPYYRCIHLLHRLELQYSTSINSLRDLFFVPCCRCPGSNYDAKHTRGHNHWGLRIHPASHLGLRIQPSTSHWELRVRPSTGDSQLRHAGLE